MSDNAWILGKTSQKYESGTRGAGTISTGAGDHGGISYGTYQLSSKAGRVQEFISTSAYKNEFSGLTVNSQEFKNKWKDLALKDPNFASAQHDFIEKTHFAPQQTRLQKSGIDLSNRSPAIQDMVWSVSVQFGPYSNLIKDAISISHKNVDINTISDRQIVESVQNYKIRNNETLFKSSDADNKAGALKRAKNEKADLLKLVEEKELETRLTEFKTEKTDLTADINVVKGQKKVILELGEHLKSHSFDNLKDVQKLDALAKTAGIELVTPAEAILADKKTINYTNKADVTALQNVLFERGLITSPSRGIFGAQTKNALIKEFDLPQNHSFGNELAAEYLEKFNPKTIEAIQEKVDLALSKVQKNLTTLENKMIVIDQSITALEAKRVALNDPTIENQQALRVAEVEIENPQNLQNTQNTESELAKLQDDLVLKQTMIAELEQKLADLTALTAQVPDQQIEKPDLKIDLLEVENKEILLTMTATGMSFNINGKDHDASYFNQHQVGITDTQSTYRNENNTLLAKYEYESDQFSIFHKNPYTVDKIAVISDFSEQNTINLVSFDAVKTQSLEKQKSLGKEC